MPKIDEKEVELCLCNGVEGPCIILNDYRVAGPKPWGGGKIVRTWKVRVGDIKHAISAKQIKLHESLSKISG